MSLVGSVAAAGFGITAGNACGGNDGAAALVVASDTAAATAGLLPPATVRSWASVGVDPRRPGSRRSG
ncbi:hypothetical protein [Streptomyces sp. NPDC005485]|uniref:hypothetical protein n=1 Tax=Streptomyces sp. NPDC005485 TaxID=3155591 RepID=UPI0033BE903D